MLKFVEREQLLSLLKHYVLEKKGYNFKCKKRVLLKRTLELQDEEGESRVFSGQIQSSKDEI
jgi:hypothetical protein